MESSWGRLSEDLWIEIFKRSSVESLRALRCVCKWWNSVISSDYLIHLHRTFNFNFNLGSSTPITNLKTYMRVHLRGEPDYTLFGPNISTHLLHFPLKSFVRGIRGYGENQCILVDVVHGVVCLSYGLKSSFDSTILWNPAIHKYLFLPFLSFDYPTSTSDLPAHRLRQTRFLHNKIGFGYDICKNDFKVVRIWMPFSHIRDPRPYLQLTYEVYSSRRGAWKFAMFPDPLQSLNPHESQSAGRTGYFFNGSILWFMQGCLLMFDCEREDFKTMELPKEIQKDVCREWPMTVQLSEYAGMLAAWVPCSFDIAALWVREDRGTWNKLYKIPTISTELEELKDIHICQPSFVINPDHPNWLDEWIRFHPLKYCSRVYDETLLLMDHPNAQSYTQQEEETDDDYTDDDGETDLDEEEESDDDYTEDDGETDLDEEEEPDDNYTDDNGETDLDDSTDHQQTDTDYQDSDTVDNHTDEDTQDS